jgi:hypothetical protein
MVIVKLLVTHNVPVARLDYQGVFLHSEAGKFPSSVTSSSMTAVVGLPSDVQKH